MSPIGIAGQTMIAWLSNNKQWVFSGIGVVILTGLLALVKRVWQKVLAQRLHGELSPEPASVLQHRKEIREQLERIPNIGDRNRWPEIIIRDANRVDDYLKDRRKEKRVSAGLKTELRGLYYGGLEVISDIVYLRRTGSHQWEIADSEDGADVCKGIRVGRIPFDSIVSVQERGDEYYPMPHIYCRYKKGTPYQHYGYYVIGADDHESYVGSWRPKYLGTWKPRILKRQRIEDAP